MHVHGRSATLGMEKPRRPDHESSPARIPAQSFLWSKVLPATLTALACVMAVLVLLAVGILLGLMPFR